MIDKDEVYATFRAFYARTPNRFYALNKTASVFDILVEDVEAIVEEAESDE